MAQYLAKRRSFIGNRLYEVGDPVEYDGPAGANLTPIGEAARLVAPVEVAAVEVEPEPVEVEVEPEVEPEPEVNDLGGTKAELIAIAEAEGVELETDDNKADIIAKIEAHRQLQ